MNFRDAKKSDIGKFVSFKEISSDSSSSYENGDALLVSCGRSGQDSIICFPKGETDRGWRMESSHLADIKSNLDSLSKEKRKRIEECLRDHDRRYFWVEKIHTEEKDEEPSKAKTVKELMQDGLAPLVLSEDKKRAIESVILQHDSTKKIFEDWGLSETISYGKGMTMLFWGDPGTGKTFGSMCIAKSVGKELKIVRTADLQSSIPGEMERNLINAFEEAKLRGKVLLLDECDSLVCSRDNVGMIIGSEINCLLTEIEKFEGVCILTTNRIGELDEALERRISLILEFPFPDEAQRLAIWRQLIPKKMPLAKDVAFEALSAVSIAGGHIKNVVLQAARFAAMENAKAVSMEHFTSAMELVSRGRGAFMGSTSKSPSTRFSRSSDIRRV
jgi:SpoVK/Ycf46/Vps4 family AAA+-type ATPase